MAKLLNLARTEGNGYPLGLAWGLIRTRLWANCLWTEMGHPRLFLRFSHWRKTSAGTRVCLWSSGWAIKRRTQQTVNPIWLNAKMFDQNESSEIGSQVRGLSGEENRKKEAAVEEEASDDRQSGWLALLAAFLACFLIDWWALSNWNCITFAFVQAPPLHSSPLPSSPNAIPGWSSDSLWPIPDAIRFGFHSSS